MHAYTPILIRPYGPPSTVTTITDLRWKRIVAGGVAPHAVSIALLVVAIVGHSLFVAFGTRSGTDPTVQHPLRNPALPRRDDPTDRRRGGVGRPASRPRHGDGSRSRSRRPRGASRARVRGVRCDDGGSLRRHGRSGDTGCETVRIPVRRVATDLRCHGTGSRLFRWSSFESAAVRTGSRRLHFARKPAIDDRPS